MREDKRHPADKPYAQSCSGCGRKAVLSIFRNEGLCFRCQIAKDVEVVKQFAEQTKKPHIVERSFGEMTVVHPSTMQRLGVTQDELELPAETIVWCAKCHSHRVAEQGQTCPVCNGHRQ